MAKPASSTASAKARRSGTQYKRSRLFSLQRSLASLSFVRKGFRKALWAHQLREARDALFCPPAWPDIEALECAWGIDDDNRIQFINRQRWSLGAYLVLLGLTLLVLWWSTPETLLGLLGMFSCGGALLLYVIVHMAIICWRLHVIESRHARSFPSWLTGKSDAAHE